MRILVISSHPDDLELGCGGTLAKYQEHEIYGYVPTRESFWSIESELLESWKVLGIKEIPVLHPRVLGDCVHRRIDRQHLLDSLIRLRQAIRPDLVFTHASNEVHQDHKVVYEESVRAFKHSSILGYCHGWNEVDKPSDERYFSSLTKEHVDKKIEALSKYESQSGRAYFNPNLQESNLKMVGLRINKPYAEAFEVIRWID